MNQNSRVYRTRTRPHHQSFERRETHGGIHALTAINSGQGTAISQVAGDYLQRRYVLPKHLSSAVCAIFVIDSVKTVAANAFPLVPYVRHWIDGSFRRQGPVK